MKILTLILGLCLNAIPALAQQAAPTALPIHRAAPAPLIGFGVPIALAVGGVLLGAKLLRRRR
jgi:uncharacterized protein (TIGR03382 family)